MAEGGFDNTTLEPEDPEIPGNDDDDNEDEQNLNETSPFTPGSASTPGPNGGDLEMQLLLPKEEKGLPKDSYDEETRFGGAVESMGAKAWSSAKERIPDMS